MVGYILCAWTLAPKNSMGEMVLPGTWQYLGALSSVQSSSVLEKGLSFCLGGFRRMNACSLARFTFGQVERENKSKERKS